MRNTVKPVSDFKLQGSFTAKFDQGVPLSLTKNNDALFSQPNYKLQTFASNKPTSIEYPTVVLVTQTSSTVVKPPFRDVPFSQAKIQAIDFKTTKPGAGVNFSESAAIHNTVELAGKTYELVSKDHAGTGIFHKVTGSAFAVKHTYDRINDPAIQNKPPMEKFICSGVAGFFETLTSVGVRRHPIGFVASLMIGPQLEAVSHTVGDLSQKGCHKSFDFFKAKPLQSSTNTKIQNPFKSALS